MIANNEKVFKARRQRSEGTTRIDIDGGDGGGEGDSRDF